MPVRTAAPAVWRSFGSSARASPRRWSTAVVGTLVLLYVTKALVGLRVNEEEEREGLDLVLHGEQVF